MALKIVSWNINSVRFRIEIVERFLREVSPDTAAAYVAMARLTADRALAAGLLKPEAAVALLDVLAGGSR